MKEQRTRWQYASVRAVREVATNTVRIELQPDTPVPVKPGAHLDVRVEIDGEVVERSYSVVDAGRSGEWIGLTVFLPRVSRGGAVFMHGLRVGDRLEITNPLQEFPLRIGAPSYVLVAGGVGITALIGMAETLQRLGADYQMHYWGQSRDRMPYLQELQVQHGERFTPHVSTEHGRASVADLIEHVPHDAELYMCGPIRLMEEIKRTWEHHGRERTALRFETFGNSGWFAAEPFEVSIPRLGIETTVQPQESMLEALERAGADVMYDCRRGECGLCEARILSLEGSVDHRDVFYSERQKEPNTKLCCCVSRVVGEDSGRGGLSVLRGVARVEIDIS